MYGNDPTLRHVYVYVFGTYEFIIASAITLTASIFWSKTLHLSNLSAVIGIRYFCAAPRFCFHFNSPLPILFNYGWTREFLIQFTLNYHLKESHIGQSVLKEKPKNGIVEYFKVLKTENTFGKDTLIFGGGSLFWFIVDTHEEYFHSSTFK